MAVPARTARSAGPAGTGLAVNPTWLVDDALFLGAAGDRHPVSDRPLGPDEIVATTGSWYYRLCRSLAGGETSPVGRLVTQLSPTDATLLRSRLANPASRNLQVLGMPHVGAVAAELAVQFGLTTTAAEAVAVCVVRKVPLVITAPNQGPRLAAAMNALDLTFLVVDL